MLFFKAFVIAFTSEELTLLLYYLEFGTYDNYVDYSLAKAPRVETLKRAAWDCRHVFVIISKLYDYVL